jgi:hypothetical protein
MKAVFTATDEFSVRGRRILTLPHRLCAFLCPLAGPTWQPGRASGGRSRQSGQLLVWKVQWKQRECPQDASTSFLRDAES